MKAFMITMRITEEQGFTSEGLKNAITNDLAEIKLSLMSYSYNNDTCKCLIEYKDFGPIPYYQIVLGGFQNLVNKYPYLKINSIDPQFVEIQ